ncbi:conserved hypothetical protein [Aurantimonas manganoxydans SI85-9A1]|uniref:Uracil-DNA glycosylase-like domain-containing protein n=1 Tax=Aurantimonas manganoxydans (strain ATCC BAA-1229 / DSM 21871 / SI85-9A1) TaxID=287752 RepID=Q1YMD0_AURMS|nr:hypothetical protein [Aurantimonas manganoxydans]EAS51451.1 conserved hypothetical protein [Aurantimonas manganoxydans SI85-9A1]
MFEPWIGPHYKSDGGLFAGTRVLVLGESHYARKAEEIGTAPDGFTDEIVRWFGLAAHNNPFFRNTVRAALGLPPGPIWKQHSAHFWNSIAFYNYVPVLVDGRAHAVGGNARRPENWMFEAGAEPFLKILDRLEPEAVIVCGLTLWDWAAPHLDGFEGKPRDVIFYDDGRSVFSRIHHPSYQKFDAKYWYPRLHRLVEMTVEPRKRGTKICWDKSMADTEKDADI